MNSKSASPPAVEAEGFDLFRIEKSKECVDLSPQIIRSYIRDGLPCYRHGKPVFVSRGDLRRFLEKKGRPLPEALQQHRDDFDLFPLLKSKESVDISANTLRTYAGQGLPIYKRGKTPYVSRRDLATFIRAGAVKAGTKRTEKRALAA